MGRGLLTGQVAVITGAGQGLGSAMAREYAAEGAAIALLERNPKTLKAVEAELRIAECRVLPFEVDVTDYTATHRVIESIVQQMGCIDILVNNAGIFRSGSILEDTLDDWRTVIAVNLEAVYQISKQAASHMITRGRGRIIHIASVAGMASRGQVGSYNASKGGVIALTKLMAVEFAPFGIAINAIAPGFLRTAQMQSDDGRDLTATDDFIEYYVNRRRIPIARAGEPEDVAGTAVFLASDYCRYMTGTVLIVDGGLMSTF